MTSHPPILVSMDSNEQGSDRAKALGMLLDASYQWAGFQELPVDMRISFSDFVEVNSGVSGLWPKDKGIEIPGCEYKIGGPLFAPRCVYVELKEISDFWSSKNTGHLGQQIMTMVSEGCPGFVAVFGSMDETMDQVPKLKKANKNFYGRKAMERSDFEMETDRNTARALCSDAMACNVPIFFLSSNYETSFKWILSMAKNILIGPNMSSWLPRFPVDPVGYGCLCSVPGIGDVAAKGLLQAYGGISQIANEAKFNPEALAACKMGNGKALGKAKAQRLCEVFA